MTLSPETRSKITPIAVWVVVLGAIGSLIWLNIGKRDVPVFSLDGERWGQWRVRRESDKGERLLLAQVRAVWGSDRLYLKGKVYRYDPADQSITEVSEKLWHKTSGTALDTDAMPPGQIRRCADVFDGRVKASCGGSGSGPVETKGETALSVDWAPTGKMFAVLTADGPLSPASGAWRASWLGGSGGYRGQHYVELFSIPGVNRKREPVRIPLTTLAGIGSPCWTSDGAYVVYSSSDGKRVCIIHTEEEQE